MSVHVETIDPMEKLSPEIGGTGYVGPKAAASMQELRTSAIEAFRTHPAMPLVVWKVLRSSVKWNRFARWRNLRIDGRVVRCEVIGSTEDWYFVSVDVHRAAMLLR